MQEENKKQNNDLGVQKSYGENYQPVKIKVRFKHSYLVKIMFGFLTLACVILGVLTICGF